MKQMLKIFYRSEGKEIEIINTTEFVPILKIKDEIKVIQTTAMDYYLGKINDKFEKILISGIPCLKEVEEAKREFEKWCDQNDY